VAGSVRSQKVISSSSVLSGANPGSCAFAAESCARKAGEPLSPAR
jgi:hypothetical protein